MAMAAHTSRPRHCLRCRRGFLRVCRGARRKLAVVSDPLTNPYAPPAAPPAPAIAAGPDGHARSNYEGERRNVLLLVVLCIFTLGLYPGIWYVRRARFVDSLDANKKIGPLPWVSLGLLVVLIVASASAEKDLSRLMQLLSGLANLFLAFRVAAILRSDFARTGRLIGISTLGVFFFGCLYLQHVLNEAAAVRARRPRQSNAASAA
jgi:hypothetical protein